MGTLKTLLQLAEKMYLDYFNNFATVPAFADYYEIDEDTAKMIIDLGKRKNNDKIINPHL